MIEINNLTTNQIDEDFFKKIAKKVLKAENKENNNLSIALVGQGRMRQLNKRYRKKNRVTDVLSFSENEIPSFKFQIPIPVKGLGEIVICLPEVKKNSKKVSSTYEKELSKVLIHGVLHLLGYDHEKSEKQAKIMEEKQQTYLK